MTKLEFVNEEGFIYIKVFKYLFYLRIMNEILERLLFY